MKFSLAELLFLFRFFYNFFLKRNCDIVFKTTAHKWCYRRSLWMCVVVCVHLWFLSVDLFTLIGHSWRFYRMFLTWMLCETTWNLYRRTHTHTVATTYSFLKNYNIIFIGHSHLKCLHAFYWRTNKFYCYMLHEL